MTIEPLTYEHWAMVKLIYEQGIKTGNATFQTHAPEWDEWDRSHISRCRIVIAHNNVVLGWAALSPVSSRCVYAGVAEVSVYVAGNEKAKGIGTRLLKELIEASEHNNFWTLQAGIFPENKASLRIHEKLGFNVVGIRDRIGNMDGVWRNTVLLERLKNLES